MVGTAFNLQLPKNENEWNSVAARFENRWNFPNYIGAMDEKHVQIQAPPGTGSYYFNYKETFSIILFAIVDSNYECLLVEVGANGKNGGVLFNTRFHQMMEDKQNLLSLPTSKKLPYSDMCTPFVFVGDDAFPLKNYIMKPFKTENLSNEKRIIYYRLSAFGILSSRFRILLNTINLHPDKAKTIVLATCYLHNFLRQQNPTQYIQKESIDIENTTIEHWVDPGSWRSNRT